MQHKEEGRKPAGECISSRQGGGFFFYGDVQQQAAGGAGHPPMRGGAGCAESAAWYEYVSSPSAFKNKIQEV